MFFSKKKKKKRNPMFLSESQKQSKSITALGCIVGIYMGNQNKQ